MIAEYLKYRKIPVLFSVICIAFYISFAYDFDRTDFVKLIGLYGALFFLFYKLVQISKTDLRFLTAISILFRLVFIVSIPSLSQDFYRFIWDGRMALAGWNPYLYLPKDLIAEGTAPIAQAAELHEGMGSLSARHYTNYPPLNQLCFIISGIFAGKSILGSVVVMRLLIILADLGTLFFGGKLLENLKLPKHYIYFYILNPFIITELSGNLHFEGIMIFFLVWSLYLLQTGKWKFSAVVLACSISIKLIPLLFLPLFLQKLGWKRAVVYYSIVGLVNILLFLPFLSSDFINNYSETIGLWFTNFEFNASIYNIIKEIGFKVKGYNIIKTVGKISPFVVILFLTGMAFLRKNDSTQKLITAMLLGLSFYFFISTTVHPWYIATLLILSVFTKYRFPLVWSLVIILSYYAYSIPGFKENYWLLAIEYLVVYGFLIYELNAVKKQKNLPLIK
ncbi:mannosyltransferase [Leptobacterium flavescens]|uniref:Mannosyltransferase n=1 Tax=Leptobacterium flavescens TaxID=472055 RepID=A0A6P0UQJ3_9FLAO|nr:glycosyltransferase 87 family protein [Leptobacterium flavescens]NER14750.1 mannosyltransferase [Leptobacterium flavescens]